MSLPETTCPTCEGVVREHPLGLIEPNGRPHECNTNGGRPERERCEYTIQRPAPIRTEKPSGRGAPVYPWAQMEPGDHFLIPCEDGERRKRMQAALQSGRNWCKRHRPDCSVTTRKVRRGVRVWMVEAWENGR